MLSILPVPGLKRLKGWAGCPVTPEWRPGEEKKSPPIPSPTKYCQRWRSSAPSRQQGGRSVEFLEVKGWVGSPLDLEWRPGEGKTSPSRPSLTKCLQHRPSHTPSLQQGGWSADFLVLGSSEEI